MICPQNDDIRLPERKYLTPLSISGACPSERYEESLFSKNVTEDLRSRLGMTEDASKTSGGKPLTKEDLLDNVPDGPRRRDKQPVGIVRISAPVPARPSPGVAGKEEKMLPTWVSPLYRTYGVGGPCGPHGVFKPKDCKTSLADQLKRRPLKKPSVFERLRRWAKAKGEVKPETTTVVVKKTRKKKK